MVPQLEKPRVTEIQVRIDCNGCVQKIKKALHGINGIYDIYIDIPQQKLTVIGWAHPEKIVKAIKKARKAATICSDDSEPAPPTEPPSEGGAPPPEPANPSPAEAVPPAEPDEPPKEPPPQESPPPEATVEPAPAPAAGAPEPPSTDSTTSQPPQPSGSKEVEDVHVVYHYPPDHSYRYGPDQNNVRFYNGRVDRYPSTPSPGYKHQPPQPIKVNHGYNTHKSTPYVTEFTSIRPPPQYTQYYSRPEPPQQYTHYRRPESSQQYTHYSRPEPSQQYIHYSRPEPPQQYTHYSRQEPPQQPTNYSWPEPLSQYMHYNGEFHSSSTGNGNITSIFSDENPNACRIV